MAKVLPTSATFLSYNPTGLNALKCDWLNNLLELVDVTYVSIQEHFRTARTIEKFFMEQFHDYNSYIMPGFRNDGINGGRPKAGLAQLSKASVSVRKERVLIDSKRVQAQILNFPSSRLLWINAYFPTDPGTITFDDRELMEVLNAIEGILDTAQFDDVLLAADMNWDLTRQTGFALSVRQFLNRVNLCSIWESKSINYTHIHTDDKSFSTIDHFIVNERLLDLVTDCGPLHLGDNMSRHSPIMVRINLGALVERRKSEVVRPRRPTWYKASEQQQVDYRIDLDKRLKRVALPDSLDCRDTHCREETHSKQRDDFVLDVMGAAIESSHKCIPIVGGRQKSARPDSGMIPGWREEVAPFRDASILWHSLWLSAGRPNTGQLYLTMKMTRNKYHHALRRVRLAADKIRAQKLLEASMLGGANWFQELKKTRGGRVNPNLPEQVAGANGEQEICEKFKDVYETLYNSENSVTEMADIKATVQHRITEEDYKEVEKVTGPVVKIAASSMKKAKPDVSTSYTSDAIRNAPDSLYDHLASVFRSWIIHGTVSRHLLACAFMPLIKSHLKNPAETKSYRAIAGSATVLMLFERVVLVLWGEKLASGSLQMGYKRNSSTAQCSYLVSETVAYFLREGTNPFMVALDMTSAFDKCRFSILFSLAMEKLPSIIVRTLIYVYERQYAWVKWGNERSSTFKISNGTRQGSILSPALFALYVQGLLDRLSSLGIGCHIGSTFVGAIAWADDFLLLAPTRTAMQKMLDTASEFSKEVGLEFSTDPNPTKSKSKAIFMVGRSRMLKKPAPLLLSGQQLPYVKQATHLGHEFHEDGTMNADTNMRRGIFIGRCLEVQESLSFAAPSDVLGAIKLYCSDLYGGMLTRLDSEQVA